MYCEAIACYQQLNITEGGPRNDAIRGYVYKLSVYGLPQNDKKQYCGQTGRRRSVYERSISSNGRTERMFPLRLM